MSEREGNVEQLRNDIQSGRTGDKVNFPDPAAAPLGADEEAAGTPPSRAAVRQARRLETTDRRPKNADPWRLKVGDVLVVALISTLAWVGGAGLAILAAGVS